MKPSLELNNVVLLGRTFEEYTRYFGLQPESWRGKKILDVASGVSSFCAEANAQGLEVTAFDPIYDWTPEEIRVRCEKNLELVAREIGGVAAYKWDFYKNPEGMRHYRECAYRAFLLDFASAKGDRYIAGQLPLTPFPDKEFALTLVSYLLFVYEEQLDYEFHRAALAELLRITAGEVRIYPLVNFKAGRAAFVDRVKADPAFADCEFEEVGTDFEFLRNSNSFLRIQKLNRAAH
ncbi:MAG: hypothetical protein ABIQ35_01960 [Verrucomicrobiota bacterium]